MNPQKRATGLSDTRQKPDPDLSARGGPISPWLGGIRAWSETWIDKLRSPRTVYEDLKALPPTMLIGGFIVLVYVFVALTSQWWTPYSHTAVGLSTPFDKASGAHWFGTDSVGRDVFTRTMFATRLEIVIAVLGTTFGFAVGIVIGLSAALVGGIYDEAMMRIAEAIHGIPTLIFAVMLVAIIGMTNSGNMWYVVLIIGFVYSPSAARLMRAAALELTTRDFIGMARTRGESTLSITMRELLPNATGTLFVTYGVSVAAAPLIVGSLGFLGIGIRPPTAEWGQMITQNAPAMLQSPATVMGPALVLVGMVVGLNMFVDGLARVLGHSTDLLARGT